MRRRRSAFCANYPREESVFDLNLTGETTLSQRRHLASPHVLFYVSAAALIVLSYFFDEHIIAEFGVMHGLEAIFGVAGIFETHFERFRLCRSHDGGVTLNRYFHVDIAGQLH